MHLTKGQEEKEHTTHYPCVNTGQLGESSETKVSVQKNINIPEDGSIRPKHVVGKTYGIFIS
jgi:hypothetical protein